MTRKILVAIDGAETTPRVLLAVRELVASLLASGRGGTVHRGTPVVVAGPSPGTGASANGGLQAERPVSLGLQPGEDVEVTLLHVVPPYLEAMRVHVPRLVEELVDVDGMLRTVAVRQGEAVVEQAARLLAEAGIEPRVKVEVGSAAECICQEAVRGGYQLVVLGRRRLSRWQELFADRVTDYVQKHCPVPVLVIA